MDVRCDRCQTEYELDDESIGGSGASVQCTTCGHTFVVSRQGAVMVGTTPPGGLGSAETPAPRVSQPSLQSSAGVPASAPPSVPEWVLATEEGQTHRLRDLTTLQKWVVERRVSRADRVSHLGGAWRALGELEELRPFFDVVDQADRQTGAARAAEPMRASEARAVRATMPATPRRLASQAPHASDFDDGDLTGRARRSRPAPEPFYEPSITDAPDDEDLSMALKPRRTGLKVFGGLVFVGLAAGAAWFMFKDPHAFHLKSGTPISTAAPAPAPAAAPAPAPAPPAEAAKPAAPEPAKPEAEAKPPDVKPAEAKVTETKAAESKAAEAKPAEAKAESKTTEAKPAEVKAGESKTAEAKAAEPKARSYEQLVSDADRALENGQSGKAQKLYDEALRQQPNGVAAMTGSAYVLLDKRHPLAAIGVFKQVLSNAPHYAPALFGLGEAYRTQGDGDKAIDAYKQYLDQSPTGTDAPAARRQIKELGEAAASPHNSGPSAPIPQNDSPIAPPPAPTP